ncbi:MAG: hypothetical protein HY821_14845 [Acidobacteria bacterium]|nr:hypothetical protein [Acidobacteriota bacterium]
MQHRPYILAPVFLSLVGCGYIGDPMPPALNIPVPIEDLRGIQRGARIYLSFTASLEATDKVMLKSLSGLELRVGVNQPGGFDMERWLQSSSQIDVKPGSGEIQVETPSAPWEGKQIIFAARSIGPTGRPARWSNLLVLNIAAGLKPPEDLTLTGTPRGVFLQWKGAGPQWRVWRQAEGEQEPAVIGTAGEPGWLDQTAEIGKSYSYTLQQLIPTGTATVESDLSKTVTIRYADRFPPATPTGFAAISGLKTIELNWDRNTEPDWKSCQVYRAEGDGPLRKLGPPISAASFSDTTAASGKKYRYAISSIDESGNESAPCAPVEIVAP